MPEGPLNIQLGRLPAEMAWELRATANAADRVRVEIDGPNGIRVEKEGGRTDGDTQSLVDARTVPAGAWVVNVVAKRASWGSPGGWRKAVLQVNTTSLPRPIIRVRAEDSPFDDGDYDDVVVVFEAIEIA